ncbi:hypothetical protein QE152_g30839 [Popillia japonica]|uniref:Uncharacterized protein n=1 Tax=Popillia japonica TaxID=7064 RepID=A0AAW1JDE8_POPJA
MCYAIIRDVNLRRTYVDFAATKREFTAGRRCVQRSPVGVKMPRIEGERCVFVVRWHEVSLNWNYAA